MNAGDDDFNPNAPEHDDRYDDPPERSTRFGGGQTRNVLGRPSGSKNRNTLVQKVARQRMLVTESGKTKRMTFLDILLITIRNRAMKGEPGWVALYDMVVELSRPVWSGIPRGVLLLPEEIPDAEEWSQRCLADEAKRETKRRLEAETNEQVEILNVQVQAGVAVPAAGRLSVAKSERVRGS